MRLRHLLPRLRAALPFNKKFHATRCGHESDWQGMVCAHGEHTFTKMPITGKKTVEYCLDCLGKMAIRCAWCDRPIFIGDAVTLYSPNDGFTVPAHAVVYSSDPMRLVGCLRWDCAQSGADRAGFWQPDPLRDGIGHVFRVPTAYELLMHNDGSSAVIIGDVTDIAEALHPTIVSFETERL